MREVKQISQNLECFMIQDKDYFEVLSPNEVRILIKACLVTKVDWQNISSFLPKRELLPVGFEIAGIVQDIGEDVSLFKKGDHVVGLVPLDSKSSGCADMCIVHEYFLVKKPSNLTFRDAALLVGDYVRAHTAIQTHACLKKGDSVLLCGLPISYGYLIAQMARAIGAQVFALCIGGKDWNIYKGLDVVCIQIDAEDTHTIIPKILEETGNLGVDVIIDYGVRMFDDDKRIMLHKHDITSCLSFRGRWITHQYDLQLDPPDSKVLAVKCASVNYMFEQAWLLFSSKLGVFQQILNEMNRKVEKNEIKLSAAGFRECQSLQEAVEICKNRDLMENERLLVLF